MYRGRLLRIALLSAILVSGCSSLPGLRVLTGENPEEAGPTVDASVEALDLVMADKTGTIDVGVSAAADRIETANDMLDIIEIRKDEENRVFVVNMLFNPPNYDVNTNEGQIAQLEATRRAFEVTWQGMMAESEGTDLIDVRLLFPQTITTLDHGRSFVGYVIAEGIIERSEAASYLAGARNLSSFYDMVINGTLNYQRASDFILYEGTPNHPMFMLPAS